MFSYPLDSTSLIRKKRNIKLNLLKKDRKRSHINIAILGGSTTYEIKNILEIFLLDCDIEPTFYESEYNKYYEDSVFENEKLKEFKPDIIYIHTTHKNITSFPMLTDSENGVADIVNAAVNKFRKIWDSLSKYNCALIQNNFDYPLDRSLGNLDCYDFRGKTYFINQLNMAFAKSARELKNLYINDINYLASYMGLKNWFDRALWYQAKYAMSMDAIPELAFNISKIINAIVGKSKKCLVLDLDNTCWGGVIGDDGVNGIHIGKETSLAEAYTSFQLYAKELKERGVMLAVCSKNDLKNAKEGFEHPDTILKFGDFTSFKADWDPKHHNIMEIANEINIGLDSLVFIDDNPVEREIVSSQIPSVSVPDIGSDVTEFIDYIDRNGFFEPINLSSDDLNRNKFYVDNKKRQEEEASFTSYDDFLISLDMIAEIKTFVPVYLERITQLTNKTNQFNLTTKRYKSSEIEQISENDNYIKLYGKLADKFGDNGLVSVVIGHISNTNQCRIDLWLMSCRVLKRDMEYAMLDELVRQCRQKNVSEIIGYYYHSPKNSMVSDLYKNFGFLQIEKNGNDTVWKLDITNYKNLNKFIGVGNE